MNVSERPRRICFLQTMISPHMAGLAVALAARGHTVTYAAQEVVSAERTALGWRVPSLYGVNLEMIDSVDSILRLIGRLPVDTVFITQGFRSNGLVRHAQREIYRLDREHFILVETVDRRGVRGPLKSLLYCFHLWKWRKHLQGVLAIGAETPEWLKKRAPRSLRIHPFAYFLPDAKATAEGKDEHIHLFRFIFVGALIPRKRADLLIEALSELDGSDFEVVIVGDGQEASRLRSLAEDRLSCEIKFLGVLPIMDVSAEIESADCLVLPSEHDGWGAVAVEALQVGTPVVCSSACGVKEVVTASDEGGVFSVNNLQALRQLLVAALETGRLEFSRRQRLRDWAMCLGATEGAVYLESILSLPSDDYGRVVPPWLRSGKEMP